MSSTKQAEIRAILAAAYSPPQNQLDKLAGAVRAKLALMETLNESLRLLVEVPAAAFSASLAPRDTEQTEEMRTNEGAENATE